MGTTTIKPDSWQAEEKRVEREFAFNAWNLWLIYSRSVYSAEFYPGFRWFVLHGVVLTAETNQGNTPTTQSSRAPNTFHFYSFYLLWDWDLLSCVKIRKQSGSRNVKLWILWTIYHKRPRLQNFWNTWVQVWCHPWNLSHMEGNSQSFNVPTPDTHLC